MCVGRAGSGQEGKDSGRGLGAVPKQADLEFASLADLHTGKELSILLL